MANKASNQQYDIWSVITKGLTEAGKMVLSVFVFIFTAGSSKEPSTPLETQHKDGWRDGHSCDGFYTGDIRNDDD
ncbi:DUF3742 family protein [Serratia fonticola]|jgi:hypothetical protein|uniref:DUF3742 family protein n=1 Tax=Serratia fonticola TaxID=47917 RepID=UPI00217B3B13|nr:DUF3742 family protein [Serratia fonticola]CAI1554492.1 Uncharacterised protein [Serratia fonticola]CAI1748670.1 Uncharacterised protein [Serratia fonticola]CAI1781559.1 Uncharacterised protein [Serratia fonticola]